MEEHKNDMKTLTFRAIVLAVIFLVMVAVVLCWLGRDTVFAWFASNKSVKSNGMTVDCTDGALELGRLIKIVPSVGSRDFEALYYMADENGGYYQVTTDNSVAEPELAGEINGDKYYFVKSNGNYMPINFTGLFPGEKLTITLSFTNTTSEQLPYRLALEDFDDKDNGTFEIPEGGGNTPGTYSVMGVFFAKLEAINGVASDSEGGFLSSYDTENGKSTNLESFEVASDFIDAGATVECVFSISVNLQQYRTLRGVYANLLSKKRFTVGSLRLSVKDN